MTRFLAAILVLSGAASAATTQPQLAFPGALGWAAQTAGGRGGKIIRVTTLAADGPGSFVEAIQTRGPRIVVFEVGGVIIRNAGARPWDRDPIDARIVADTIEGRGEIIDSEEQVGGYPQYKETRQAFDEKAWDLKTMTPLVAPTTRNVPK